MMRSWTRRNGSNPLGSLSLDPRCGKIRADVNRQIIQKIARTAEGGMRSKSLFGSGLAGLGLVRLLIELYISLQPRLNTIYCGGDRYRSHQRAIFGGGPFSR